MPRLKFLQVVIANIVRPNAIPNCDIGTNSKSKFTFPTKLSVRPAKHTNYACNTGHTKSRNDKYF